MKMAKTDFGILVEFAGGDVVDWEHELDIVLLRLLDKLLDLLRTCLVEE